MFFQKCWNLLTPLTIDLDDFVKPYPSDGLCLFLSTTYSPVAWYCEKYCIWQQTSRYLITSDIVPGLKVHIVRLIVPGVDGPKLVVSIRLFMYFYLKQNFFLKWCHFIVCYFCLNIVSDQFCYDWLTDLFLCTQWFNETASVCWR